MKFNRFLQIVLTFVLFVSMASCEKPQVQPTPTPTPNPCACPTETSTTEGQGPTPTPCVCLFGQPASTQIPNKTALLGGCSEADLTSVETKNYVSAVIEQLSNPDVTKITLLLSEVQSAYDSLPVCVRDYIETYNTSLAVVMTISQQILSETDPAKLQAYTDALTKALQDNVDNSPLFANLSAASEGAGSQGLQGESTLKILDPNTINRLEACSVKGSKGGVVYSKSLVAAGGSPFKGYTWSAKNLPMGTTIWPLTGVFTSNGGALNPGMPEMMVEVTVSDGTSSVSAMLPFKLDIVDIACPVAVFLNWGGVPGTALEDAWANKPYGASLSVHDGVPPYSWVEDTSYSGRGDFALSGLKIDMSTGVVWGTPFNSASGKTLSFRVIVTDSEGRGADFFEKPIFTIYVH